MSSIRAEFLLLFAAAALAGDETHPRSPERELAIGYTPWSCPRCQEEGRTDGDAKPGPLMGKPAAEIAATTGSKQWFVVESPNFRLFSSLKKTRVRRRDSRFVASDLQRLEAIFPKLRIGTQATRLDAHQRAHLIHIRLERLYAHFAALVANDKRWLGMRAPYEVFLFEREDEFRTFVVRIVPGVDRVESVLRWHRKGTQNSLIFATCAERFEFDDVHLHNVLFHNVAENLVSGHRNYLTDIWGWLEEGVAHYYARRESDRFHHFCVGQRVAPAAWASGDWRPQLRRAVAKREEPSLALWCEKRQSQELADLEHPVAWSIVEWLATTDPIRLAQLIERGSDARKKMTGAAAIEDVFGIDAGALHERWRAHVLATYRKR